MKALLVAAAMTALLAVPVGARAYTLTSGTPIVSDISLVGCAITNTSLTATMVIDGIDFIDADGHSCSALETSGCAASPGGSLPPGGFTIQLMCNHPTDAPPAGCGSTVRCEVKAHGVSATKVRALTTYVTTAGPILTVPLY